MKKLKLLKRPMIFYQALLFLPLSCFFVLTIKAIGEGRSILDFLYWQKIVHDDFFIGLYVASFFGFYWVLSTLSKYSFIPIILITIGVSAFSFYYFGLYFQKWILILYTFYLGISIINLMAWAEEIKRPIYNPLFHPDDLSLKSNAFVPIKIFNLKRKSHFNGVMTNWGTHEIVARLPVGTPILKGKNVAELEYNGQIYKGEMQSISSFYKGQGIGLFTKLKEKENEKSHINNFLLTFKKNGHFL